MPGQEKLVSGSLQVTCHRSPHDAQADESDIAHVQTSISR
jgi:hypothetical protein